MRRRVVLCSYPGLYAELVLETLLQSPELELVGMIHSTRVLRKGEGRWRGSVRHIQLSGLRYAAYLFAVTDLYRALRALFVKFGRAQAVMPPALPVLETADINEPVVQDFLRLVQPDLLLCAHFNQLLGPELLALPKLAPLNIHPSLLPALQGVDPAFYALLRHLRETGVTVHIQDQQFDHGAILAQTPVQVRPHDTLLSLNVKLFKRGALSAVQQILGWDARNPGTAQSGSGQYDSWPNPYETQQFRQQRRYLRWKEYLALLRR